MSTTPAAATAQPTRVPVAEPPKAAADDYNPNPMNVEAEVAEMIGGLNAPPVSEPAPAPAAPAAPAPEPAPAVPPEGSTPAPAAPAPAPAPEPQDELPNRVRINLANLPDEPSKKAAAMLRRGFSLEEINAVLAKDTPPAAPAPAAGVPAEPAPAPVDPVVAASQKVADITTQLAAAKSVLNYDEEARLQTELVRAVQEETLAKQSAQTQQAAVLTRSEQIQNETAEDVFQLYPELETQGSDYHLKSLELHKQNVADGRPVVQDPAYLRFLADQTAIALGQAPRVKASQPAASAPAPVPPAPVVPPVSAPLNPAAPVPVNSQPPRSANPNAPAPAPAAAPAQPPGNTVDASLKAMIGNDPLGAEAYESVG